MNRRLAILASISRFHIVAIAALGTFTFGWLFSGEYLWLLPLVCAGDWFVVNLLNRVVDLPEDQANDIPGAGFVARHRRAVLATGLGVLGSSLAAVHLLAPELTPWRVFYHALGFSYNWPMLPGGRRIKQLYFFKNTASALGFLVTLFAYPLAWMKARYGVVVLPSDMSWTTVLVAAAFFFPLELSYEVIYDLRDEPGDRAAGVATYPVVHGPRVAGRIVYGLCVAALAVLVGGYAAGQVPWRLVVMATAPVLQIVVFSRLQRRGYVTTADCVNITWAGAALLAAYHLWNLAGLPGAWH